MWIEALVLDILLMIPMFMTWRWANLESDFLSIIVMAT